MTEIEPWDGGRVGSHRGGLHRRNSAADLRSRFLVQTRQPRIVTAWALGLITVAVFTWATVTLYRWEGSYSYFPTVPPAAAADQGIVPPTIYYHHGAHHIPAVREGHRP